MLNMDNVAWLEFVPSDNNGMSLEDIDYNLKVDSDDKNDKMVKNDKNNNRGEFGSSSFESADYHIFSNLERAGLV